MDDLGKRKEDEGVADDDGQLAPARPTRRAWRQRLDLATWWSLIALLAVLTFLFSESNDLISAGAKGSLKGIQPTDPGRNLQENLSAIDPGSKRGRSSVDELARSGLGARVDECAWVPPSDGSKLYLCRLPEAQTAFLYAREMKLDETSLVILLLSEPMSARALVDSGRRMLSGDSTIAADTQRVKRARKMRAVVLGEGFEITPNFDYSLPSLTSPSLLTTWMWQVTPRSTKANRLTVQLSSVLADESGEGLVPMLVFSRDVEVRLTFHWIGARLWAFLTSGWVILVALVGGVHWLWRRDRQRRAQKSTDEQAGRWTQYLRSASPVKEEGNPAVDSSEKEPDSPR